MLVIALSALAFGCRDQGTTIWSTEVPSPDDQWVATAVTKRWNGPGNAYAATIVYLKRASGSQRPVEILDFSGGDPTSRPGWPMNIQWITKSHLDIAFDGDSHLDFQVSKVADIEISVEDVSNAERKYR